MPNSTEATKTDLRVLKTRRAIREAFLAIRQTTRLEKVKVLEVCERALVNPTTFYKHYRDIFDLSDILEDEAIAAVLTAFANKDRLFSDPAAFLTGLPLALDSERCVLEPLFRDRMDVFFRKLEIRLKDLYMAGDSTPEQSILVTFAVGGTIHTLRQMKVAQVYDDTLIAVVTQIIDAISGLDSSTTTAAAHL